MREIGARFGVARLAWKLDMGAVQVAPVSAAICYGIVIACGTFLFLKTGTSGYVSSYIMKKVNLVRYIPDPCEVSP
jgi:hypothetical protein